MSSARKACLVAGIGNVFLGDDGFGVAVAQQLARRSRLPGADVVDFGIRGLDFAYALQDGYAMVIVVDAMPRGGLPGTIYLLDAAAGAAEARALDGHSLPPQAALALAALGSGPAEVVVVGCEPGTVPDGAEIAVGLSAPVAAAVDRAVALVESLVLAGRA